MNIIKLILKRNRFMKTKLMIINNHSHTLHDTKTHDYV